MTMGDRVAVLKDGLLQQCDSPRELFTRPVNMFVAGFIGSPAMNMVHCTVDADGAEFSSMRIPLTPEQRSSLTSDSLSVGVRPEGLHLSPDGTGMHATIMTVEELGSDSFLYCTPEGHPDLTVVSRAEGLSGAKAGDTVALRPDPGALHLFDTFTGIPFAHPGDGHAVGDFADTDEAAVRALIPAAVFHVGTFPQTMPPDLPGIAFAHIDADQYQSIADAIDRCGPLMVPGSVMWFDDCGSLQSADRAVLERLHDRVDRQSFDKWIVRY
jgi:hypothetical protein